MCIQRLLKIISLFHRSHLWVCPTNTVLLPCTLYRAVYNMVSNCWKKFHNLFKNKTIFVMHFKRFTSAAGPKRFKAECHRLGLEVKRYRRLQSNEWIVVSFIFYSYTALKKKNWASRICHHPPNCTGDNLNLRVLAYSQCFIFSAWSQGHPNKESGICLHLATSDWMQAY